MREEGWVVREREEGGVIRERGRAGIREEGRVVIEEGGLFWRVY